MSAINREDAIKALEDVGAMYPYRIPGKPETYDHYNEGWSDATDKAVQAIEALPDADDGWISVENRLPKIGNTVLATRFISKDHTYVDMSSYQGQDIGWKSNFDTYYGTNPYKVMAWRPLPKPYKSKEDTQ